MQLRGDLVCTVFLNMRIDPGLNECEYVKNNTCELHIRNEYESDLCNNEH